MPTNPDVLPADLPGLFTLLYAGAGAVFGLIVVWLTNQLIARWEARTHAPISETKRRWISLGVPAGLVFLGYGGLVACGIVAFTGQTVYLACVNALAAMGAKQAAYATIASTAKPAIVQNTTNIGTVQADRDLYLGSTRTDDDSEA